MVCLCGQHALLLAFDNHDLITVVFWTLLSGMNFSILSPRQGKVLLALEACPDLLWGNHLATKQDLSRR